MYNIRMHRIDLDLRVREQERKKMNKIEIFTLGFVNFEKCWQNLWNGFNNRIAKGCRLQAFAFLAFLWSSSYILCIQVAILNLPHPYLRR